MSDTPSTDTAAADFIDAVVPLAPGHPLQALRRERPRIVEATQACQQAMFGDAVAGLSVRHRQAVALQVCRLAGATALAARYAQALLEGGAPPDHVQSIGTDGVAAVVSPRLAALLQFAGTLTRRPLDGDRAAIAALQAAGLDAADIVALAQLVAYLAYQVRLVAGLQALAAAGPAPALRSEIPGALPAPPVVPPSGAVPLQINGFTTATLGWQPWLPTVTPETATPEQLAALDAMNASARQSPYFLLLAHQPALLLQRSIAFNAIMFAPGGLSRAERELGATVESVHNGCVYCTAVHAQRFEQLARRNDVIRQLFTQPEGAGTTPRERAIVAFSARLGVAPQALAAADVAALRAAGLDDREVLDLVHAVALFGWANRLMLNLGEAVWPAPAAGEGGMTRRTALAGLLLAGVLAAGLAAAPLAAVAQAQPAAPADARLLKILVPFAAGGAQDVMARHIAPRLAARTGLTVVVENRAGAGGQLAADAVAKAGPDAPLLLMATGGAVSIAPHLHARLPYDPVRDLQPLVLVADTPMTVAVRADSPLRTLADLVREARARPGQVNYGSTGQGTVSHLAGALLAQAAGVDLLHVPYKGAAPALADLLGGQIGAVVMSAASVDPMADAGRLRVLGTFSRSHLASLGNPPTVAEALKLPGLEVPVWVGLLAPARLPADQARRLAEALLAVCRQDDTRQAFAALGASTTCAGPAELGQVIADDSQRWGAVIRKGNIRLE